MSNLHKKTSSTLYRLENYEIEHQYDDYGNHCIIVHSIDHIPYMYLSSDWVNHRTIADVIIDDKTFMGASEYYAGVLPPVFRIIKASVPIMDTKFTKEEC